MPDPTDHLHRVARRFAILAALSLLLWPLSYGVAAFACTMFAVGSWANWTRGSFVLRKRAGDLPRWLAEAERIRAYLADEDFEGGAGLPDDRLTPSRPMR